MVNIHTLTHSNKDAVRHSESAHCNFFFAASFIVLSVFPLVVFEMNIFHCIHWWAIHGFATLAICAPQCLFFCDFSVTFCYPWSALLPTSLALFFFFSSGFCIFVALVLVAALIYNRQIEIVIASRLPLGRRLITRFATESGFTLWCTQLLSGNPTIPPFHNHHLQPPHKVGQILPVDRNAMRTITRRCVWQWGGKKNACTKNQDRCYKKY